MIKTIKKQELINFIICGLLSAAIYFTVLAFLIEVFNLDSLIAYSFSYIISSIFNFFYNKKITFKSDKSTLLELIKYLIMLGISYTVGVYIIKILTINFGISIYISSIVSIALTTIFRFLVSKKVVYK